MINYLLRKELTERQKWREHATEAAEISDYCRDEAITAATQWLATPAGLLSSFSLGAVKVGQETESGTSKGRKRHALWRFAQTVARSQLL